MGSAVHLGSELTVGPPFVLINQKIPAGIVTNGFLQECLQIVRRVGEDGERVAPDPGLPDAETWIVTEDVINRLFPGHSG